MSNYNRFLFCLALISGLAVAPPGQAETPEFLDKRAEELAGDILKAVRQRDLAFFDWLVPARESQNGRLPDDLGNFIFSVSDVAMWRERDPCESTIQPIKSVSEIILDAPNEFVFRVVKDSQGQGLTPGYRIYYYDRDYLDLGHVLPETVSRYQMRCFVSTYVEYTGKKWQAPDLFDFSRYKDRFLNRIPASQRHVASPISEEARNIAYRLYDALWKKDRKFLAGLVPPSQRENGGLAGGMAAFLFELEDDDAGLGNCDPDQVPVRSVIEVLEGHMFGSNILMQRLPKPDDVGKYYRIYFSYGHDNFYRGKPSEAPDPYELTLPLAPVLKQYQMRCYASTELVKGEDGWYSPDLFDYSLFRERFERREFK